MKTSTRFALSVLLLRPIAGWAAPAEKPGADRVAVTFDHPEKFIDVRDDSTDFENERGRDHFLPILKEHLERRAGKLLPAGQKLAITFTDIDLAGDFEPWRGMNFHDVRIVKDLYVPRMNFTFKVTDEAGQVVKEGEEKLLDAAFQMRITGVSNTDPLRYEKEMLNDWLRKEFPARKK
ncbi:MAG TPA: DUF3016 domain-containing protein [Lacunisphaera sp.]